MEVFDHRGDGIHFKNFKSYKKVSKKVRICSCLYIFGSTPPRPPLSCAKQLNSLTINFRVIKGTKQSVLTRSQCEKKLKLFYLLLFKMHDDFFLMASPTHQQIHSRLKRIISILMASLRFIFDQFPWQYLSEMEGKPTSKMINAYLSLCIEWSPSESPSIMQHFH